MNASNPKFWALIGAAVGFVLAAGGEVNTPIDALLGALIQAAIWYGVSKLIIDRKNKKKS